MSEHSLRSCTLFLCVSLRVFLIQSSWPRVFVKSYDKADSHFHWYFYEGVFRLAEVIRSPKARRNQWPVKPSDRKTSSTEILIPEIHIGRGIPYEKILIVSIFVPMDSKRKHSLHSFLSWTTFWTHIKLNRKMWQSVNYSSHYYSY